MTDDLLDTLRTDTSLDLGAPVRDVGEIHRRAHALRVRRRLRVGASSAMGIAAALAVAGVVLPQDAGTGGTPAAAVSPGVAAAHAADGAEVDCRLGFGSVIDLADLAERPDVASLVVLLEDGTDVAPLRGVSAGQEELACPQPAPALVLYDVDPVRGIAVYPDVANAYEGEEGLVTTQVRGTQGQLMTLETGSHILSWVESDGERWLAEASGVEVNELVGVLDSMEIADDDTVSADPLDAFETAPVLPPANDVVIPAWGVQYGSPGADWTPDRVTVGVRKADEPTATLASRWSGLTPTQVAGHLAFYDPGPDGEEVGALFWDADGLRFTLTGTGGPERLVELAEHLEPVSVDDPRLFDVPDLRDVLDKGH